MVFWIGKSRMMFESKYRLNAEFKSVAGLGPGADVRIAGIRKGTVSRIDLPQNPDQKVRVEMTLDDETRKIIKEDSSAAIRTEGLMGDQYVEISVGTHDSPSVKDNDTLQGAEPLEISDLIRKANGILDSANGAVNNVSQTAGNLGSITAKINNGAGTVGALVNDKTVYQNVEQASAELQEDLEAAKHNFLLGHFFHKRGYEDSVGLTRNLIPELPAVPPIKRFDWSAQQIFNSTATAKLKSKGTEEKTFSDAGNFLQMNPFGLAVVVGYAGMKGDTQHEKVLSEAQAMVVRDYLVGNYKMDDKRVKTIGIGKSPDANEPEIALLVYPEGTNIPAGAGSKAPATRKK